MSDKLKEVIAVDRMVEAQIIKTKLASEGIAALLKYESAGQVYGIMINGLAKISVLVEAEQLQAAAAILAATDDSTDQEPND